ncbi:hypothetical protein [Marinobacter sp.]|uniref:hypothetical protein n=1 Tax=Marinobacter sp. TaxID=50741 RepID=UPI0035662D64
MDSAQYPPLKPMRFPIKVSTVLCIALLLMLVALNQPLKTPAAPQGMISLQLSGTAEQAQAILASWRHENLSLARLSLWIDFLFIAAYLTVLFQLTRRFTADRPGVREKITGRWIRSLFIIAAVSDVGENIVLLNNFSPPDNTLSMVASILALVKFTGLLLGVAGLVIIRAARRQPLTPAS